MHPFAKNKHKSKNQWIWLRSAFKIFVGSPFEDWTVVFCFFEMSVRKKIQGCWPGALLTNIHNSSLTFYHASLHLTKCWWGQDTSARWFSSLMRNIQVRLMFMSSWEGTAGTMTKERYVFPATVDQSNLPWEHWPSGYNQCSSVLVFLGIYFLSPVPTTQTVLQTTQPPTTAVFFSWTKAR